MEGFMCNISVCILAQIATMSNYQSMRMDACGNRKKMHSFASVCVCVCGLKTSSFELSI